MDSVTTASPLRVLLVEDNEHDRLAFRRALNKNGAGFGYLVKSIKCIENPILVR